MIFLTQAKSTTKDKPPYRDLKEQAKFIEYCAKIKATPFWARRWKVKNKYIRELATWDYDKLDWDVTDPDWSDVLQQKSKSHI
jgi:hypothetical protein